MTDLVLRLRDGHRFLATIGLDGKPIFCLEEDGEWRIIDWAEASQYALAVVRGEFEIDGGTK